MIKALLIVMGLSGGVDYTTEMPTMKSCLDARTAIAKQDDTLKTLCVPRADESEKIQSFFMIFMNMIDQIKEFEEVDKLNGEEDCERPFGALDCKE